MMQATLTATLLLAFAAAAVAAPGHDAAVRAAIAHAVVASMGADAAVTVERLQSSVSAPAPAPARALRAVPPPGARTGRLVSFALFDGQRRVGTATALVRVSVPHVRATASVARDTALKATDVTLVEAELEGARFVRVPEMRELVGSLVRRDVAAGEPLTHALVEVPPAVRSGDEVEVVSRVGAVEARGTGRASGSGYVGGRIRVSSSGQKTLRPARVVSPGVVGAGGSERARTRRRSMSTAWRWMSAGLVATLVTSATASAQDSKARDDYEKQLARHLETAKAISTAGPSGNWMAGLFSDLRARNVNDLVTVRVVESVTAAGSADSALDKNSNSSASLTKFFGAETRFPSWIDPTSLVAGGANTQFTGSGSTTRAGSLTAVITARVIQVLPNGDLVLEGIREVDINGDRQFVVLSGIVRVRDIGPGNVVFSTAVGQMQIRYFGQGLIKDNLKPGWVVRFLNKVF